MHFDLPLGLYWSRENSDGPGSDFLSELQKGDIRLAGVALYVEDEYLPDRALQVALDQVSLVYREIAAKPVLTLCRSFEDVGKAMTGDRIGLMLTMEGAEPLNGDPHLLRLFYELGLRSLSLTHSRRNAAAAGAVFAPSGSPEEGLSDFGRAVIAECAQLGIVIDLAHINPRGFEEICAATTGPVIVSHTNARRYYDIERNVSDAQIRMIGERGGVIGVNAILLGRTQEESTIDRYIDHIEHVAHLIGLEGVAIGFDFCQFLWQQMSPSEREAIEARTTRPYFPHDLSNHSHARNLTRRLLERGFTETDVVKILRENWLRVLGQTLTPAPSSPLS